MPEKFFFSKFLKKTKQKLSKRELTSKKIKGKEKSDSFVEKNKIINTKTFVKLYT